MTSSTLLNFLYKQLFEKKNNQHKKKAHRMNAFESTPPLFAFNLSSFRPAPFVFEEKKRKNQILIKNVIAKLRGRKTKQWTGDTNRYFLKVFF